LHSHNMAFVYVLFTTRAQEFKIVGAAAGGIMSEELKKEEQETLNKLYESVAHRIAQDESMSIIVADLVKQGWSVEAAVELVNNVEETIEEYEEPSEEWKRNRAIKYVAPMVVGFLLLVAGIVLFVYGFVSPEFEFILPIGLLVVGLINFSWGLTGWLKHR